MRAMSLFLLFVLGAFIFGGCTTEESKTENPAPTQASGIPQGKMPDDEIHRGLKAPDAAEPSAKLTTLKKAQDQAKATFDKNPKDAKAKSAYIAATVKLGTATMNADELPPREKYRGALTLYREALKLDPQNKEALANKKLIEDIYKSMGRPIPQ
jgi:hypothetical protein